MAAPGGRSGGAGAAGAGIGARRDARPGGSPEPRGGARAGTGAEASTAAAGETRDALLGGRVWLRQPARGYRAGVDAVFLAAACPARPGARVLDLGCGVGAAALCLAARVPDLAITGVERDA